MVRLRDELNVQLVADEGEDEDATHRVLRDYLELIASAVKSRRGKLMHYADDAALAKFHAAVDALSTAVAIHNELNTLNHGLPDERRVHVRIGVDLGDVIEDRGDIYGDGVNVAARLESLAEPGGICISDAVRQEYFSDGMTEDIITELSRYRSLFVISRNSTFHYKGESPGAQQLGKELGVHYIVEGSVRKSGNRVRVTAQLVEADSGNHLWAERRNGTLRSRTARRFRGTGRTGRRDRKDHTRTARNGLHPARPAHTRLATIHAYHVFARGKSPEEGARMARFHAEKTLEIDSTDPLINAVVAAAYILVGSHGLARQHIMRAISLNPNDSTVIFYAAIVLAYLGENDKALSWMRRFQRHNPNIRISLIRAVRPCSTFTIWRPVNVSRRYGLSHGRSALSIGTTNPRAKHCRKHGPCWSNTAPCSIRNLLGAAFVAFKFPY